MMRSDRDKRTDTEREIDDFLSKFENPADELSADINSYLDEDEQERDDNDKNAVINDQDTVKKAPVQTFSWKIIDPPETETLPEVSFDTSDQASSAIDDKTIIVDDKSADLPEAFSAGSDTSDTSEDPENQESISLIDDHNDNAESKDNTGIADTVENADTAENSETSDITDTINIADTADAAGIDSDMSAAVIAAAENAGNGTDTVSAPETGGKKVKAAKKDKTAKKGGISHALFLKKNKDFDPSQGATYVKDGKTIKNKEYKFSFLKLIRDFVVIGAVCVLAGLIVAISMTSIHRSKPLLSYITTKASRSTTFSILRTVRSSSTKTCLRISSMLSLRSRIRLSGSIMVLTGPV